jgi:RimJ/RimL family protein N-acetyltransferase
MRSAVKGAANADEQSNSASKNPMRRMEVLQEICAMRVGSILPTGNLSRQAFPDRSAVVARQLSARHAKIARMKASKPAPRTNEFGQPIGRELPGWSAPPFPPREVLTGRYCRVEPLAAARHARDLWEAQQDDSRGERWTYAFHGPYASFADYEQWCVEAQAARDPQFYAIVDLAHGRAVGSCAYMRIEPKHGVIEIGNIHYTLRLARTRAATEAMYLLLANAFALGYRRYEWKCDSCNLPSRAAATRLGFTYEGMFRQAIVNKGRNRDTTWFAIIDRDWNGGLREAYLRWLDPANFDARGGQKLRLSALTAPCVEQDSAQAWPPLPRASGQEG